MLMMRQQCWDDNMGCCVGCTGLQEGLSSLVEAGFPPRFLIIDDGWQMTDVDKRFRQAPTTRMMPQLPAASSTSDEFFDAELEMLATAIKDIPPSSSAGNLMHQTPCTVLFV